MDWSAVFIVPTMSRFAGTPNSSPEYGSVTLISSITRALVRIGFATVDHSPPLRYGGHVKATTEYDETRLKRVMKLTGLKSRKAALDYALREAEHAAKVRRFLQSLLPDAEYAGAVAPDYDVLTVREKDAPYRA
jgi:Arc/MetJ family transcription regulator